MKYNINPCKACFEKYKNGVCDINNINNCCYETLGAFNGWNSINQFRGSQEVKNCEDCVKQMIYSMGKTPCDLRIAKPPLFTNVPNYFPELLAKTNNPEKAKVECLNMCSLEKMVPLSCSDRCNTQYSALEKYTENPTASADGTAAPVKNNIVKYMALALGLLILSFLIMLAI